MSRGKVSNEQRLAAAKACAEGKMSLREHNYVQRESKQ